MPFEIRRWSIAVALMLVTGGALAIQGQDKPAAPVTPVVTPPAEKPKPVILLDQVLDQVTLAFVDHPQIAFDRPGVLEFVVEESEMVTKGQVLARLRSEPAVAALAVAVARVMNTAEIDSARKQAESSIHEYGNAKASNLRTTESPRASFTDTAIKRLQLLSEASTIEIERFVKEHAVNEKTRDQAQAELNTYEVKAPCDGVIVRAIKQVGEGVQVGETVVKIVSTKRIRAEAEVDLAIVPLLKIGGPVTVLVDFPGAGGKIITERFTTLLKHIDPTVDQTSQRVRIFAEIDNTAGRLREGLHAKMELGTE